LARAFFYAGAPSLLVSRWSVEEKATERLMTEIFHTYAGGQTSHAEALQAAMRSLASGDPTDRPSWLAHPFAWASFFIVGEGGRTRH
jgi:CHAT domain-containing protein